MWVVQFKHSMDADKEWVTYKFLRFTREEEAATAMAIEVFEAPSWEYRIVEVPD